MIGVSFEFNSLALRQRQSSGIKSIRDLFPDTPNVGGAWHWSKTFADEAMTTAAVEGNAIAAFEDQGGYGTHLIPANNASRPTLANGYATFDVVDDFVGTGNLVANSDATLVYAVQLDAGAYQYNYLGSIGDWDNSFRLNGSLDTLYMQNSGATRLAIPESKLIVLTQRLNFAAGNVTVEARLTGQDWQIDTGLDIAGGRGFGFPSTNANSRVGSAEGSYNLLGAVWSNRIFTDAECDFAAEWVLEDQV